MEQDTEDRGVRLVWNGGTFGDGSTIVSKEDVDRVLPLSLWKDADGYIRCSGAHPYRYLHNFIIGHSDPDYPVDHRNDVRNDNRRSNLRVLTRAVNTSRPWRVDDEEEARLLQDYADGKLLRSEVHEALRKLRDK